MEQNLIQGKIVLFGTPAEESTNGKATLVNEKLVQNNVDYAMMLVSLVCLIHKAVTHQFP